MKRLALTALLLALLGIGVLAERHRLTIYALALLGPPDLLEPQDEGPGVRWYDDYFTIQAFDERTFAIGEPRYAQQVFNYLIVGDTRAVLFDAGPGLRDVRAVAESLTDRPITFVPSHFHYDHVGNRITFDRVAVIDLPGLRARATDGRLRLSFEEHLGTAEGIGAPTLTVDEWLAPDSEIDLGGRRLRVLHTPGHTDDSISLLDAEAGLLFTGDFIYPGPLFAFLPNSSLPGYLEAAEGVLRATPPDARVLGAHRTEPPGAPVLAVTDVEDLRRTLEEIRTGARPGRGFYPVTYRVNDRMSLMAEPGWLRPWSRARGAH